MLTYPSYMMLSLLTPRQIFSTTKQWLFFTRHVSALTGTILCVLLSSSFTASKMPSLPGLGFGMNAPPAARTSAIRFTRFEYISLVSSGDRGLGFSPSWRWQSTGEYHVLNVFTLDSTLTSSKSRRVHDLPGNAGHFCATERNVPQVQLISVRHIVENSSELVSSRC